MTIEILKKGSNAIRICEDIYEVYDCIMALENDNHEKAADVQGWAELAYKGEIYEGERFIAICK